MDKQVEILERIANEVCRINQEPMMKAVNDTAFTAAGFAMVATRRKARAAYCETECPNSHHICEKGCESLKRFTEILERP